MASKKIAILVVEDHPLTRIGICTTINAQADMIVTAQADNGEDAVTAFHRYSPDVVVMDLGLPRMNGIEAISFIRKRASPTKIIVLTTYEGDEDIYQALKAGAEGYVIKGMPHEVLLDAIRSVYQGDQFLPPPVAKLLKERNLKLELRSREREVLALIVSGKSNKEIASALGITEGTVKCHVSEIFLRLGVTDRTQAALVALQRGLVHL